MYHYSPATVFEHAASTNANLDALEIKISFSSISSAMRTKLISSDSLSFSVSELTSSDIFTD